MSTPVILGCDPGHDDTVALLLALASQELGATHEAVTTPPVLRPSGERARRRRTRPRRLLRAPRGADRTPRSMARAG